jgi:hypothetical protein
MNMTKAGSKSQTMVPGTHKNRKEEKSTHYFNTGLKKYSQLGENYSQLGGKILLTFSQ